MSTQFPNLANGGTPPVLAGAGTTPPPVPPQHAWTYARHILKPGDIDLTKGFEFPALARAVNEHLTNHLGRESRLTAPRMLWIQGKPGEGKTTGAKRACLRAGYHIAVISAGTLAGEVEGAPVRVLNELLAELEHWSTVHHVRVALLLDDFDNSTANTGADASHTINSQLLTNEMMALADKRQLYVNADGTAIPFILSANDATGMRESLTRTGRALWFTHAPSPEDRANFAWFILGPKTTAERDLVAALVRRNIRQTIAFWEAMPLKMRAIQNQSVLGRGVPDQRTVDMVFNTPLSLTPEIAWEAARQLRHSRVDNFLKRRWGRR